jgi:hypothetical protein
MSTASVESSIEKLFNLMSKKDMKRIEIVGKCDKNGLLIEKMVDRLSLNNSLTYTVSLVNLTVTTFFPNITDRNNTFYYNDGTETKTIKIATGGYNISDLNSSIHWGLQQNGFQRGTKDYYPINIIINSGSGKCVIELKDNYKVYFKDKTDTFRELLGFGNVDLTTNGLHISSKIVNVTPVEKVFLRSNICTGSNLNGRNDNILFSFSNNKRYGSLLSISPNPLIPCLLLISNIDQIRLEFKDQNDSPVDFLGSTVCITILISQV